ncbi:MAG: helical backbone metal receptor, partial [Steroidobacteraceae bacterium]
VGTAEFSDAPAAARRIPRIGDAHAVDLERVLALAPDVVVVWEDGNSSAQIATLERLQLPIYRVRVASLADLPASIERLGDLAGTAPAAQAEAARLRAKLTDIAATYRGRAPLRVFLEIWNEPLYTIGGAHPISDAVRYCGGLNLFGDLRGNGPTISIEAVIARDPQAIVAIAPVGAAQAWLAAWRRFPSIDAVRRGALLAFEDQRLSRLGPGTIDATEVLCAQLATVRAARPGEPRID